MSKCPKPGSQRIVVMEPNMQPIINVPTLGHLLSDTPLPRHPNEIPKKNLKPEDIRSICVQKY